MQEENEKTYILTDGCFWELNEQTGNEHPHSVEVVDLENGAVRYIRSGSRIKFIEGEITDIRTQETYRKAKGQEAQEGKEVPGGGQDMPDGEGSEMESRA